MRNLVTVEQLEKELKQGTLEPLYLFYGEEIYLLESCLKRMKKIFGQTQVGINEIRMDDTSVSHLISDIETPAFGYEKKLIIARNTGLFQTEGKKKTENPEIHFFSVTSVFCFPRFILIFFDCFELLLVLLLVLFLPQITHYQHNHLYLV